MSDAPGRQRFPHLQRAEVEMISKWQDPNEVRVANWLTPWDFEEPIEAGIVGVPMARGAIKQVGANAGPTSVRQTGFFFTTYSIDYGVDLQDMPVRDLGDIRIPLLDVPEGHEQIEAAATAIFAHEPHFVPIFIGGDHSIMRPLVNGLAKGRPETGKIGIIHFDAHMDAQVLDFQGPHNGTPVRGLLDVDDVDIDGRNIAQIGISGFVNSRVYHEYLIDKGATVFTSRDVYRGDFEQIIREAYEIAADGTDAVYITYDIDGVEMVYAPGTGASITGGMTGPQMLEAMWILGQCEKVAALEISEIDPTRDLEQMTSRLAMKCILNFLAGVRSRTTPPVPLPRSAAALPN